jgi:hypothetical protein
MWENLQQRLGAKGKVFLSRKLEVAMGLPLFPPLSLRGNEERREKGGRRMCALQSSKPGIFSF